MQAAIDAEKAGLLLEGTWKESEIISKEDALTQFAGSTVYFGSLMVIVSIKGYEKKPTE